MIKKENWKNMVENYMKNPKPKLYPAESFARKTLKLIDGISTER